MKINLGIELIEIDYNSLRNDPKGMQILEDNRIVDIIDIKDIDLINLKSSEQIIYYYIEECDDNGNILRVSYYQEDLYSQMKEYGIDMEIENDLIWDRSFES